MSGRQWFKKSTGEKVMLLRTDNGRGGGGGGGGGGGQGGGGGISRIRHELTVPNTPEQNGVAERMNRTVVETVCSMPVATQIMGGSSDYCSVHEKPKSNQCC